MKFLMLLVGLSAAIITRKDSDLADATGCTKDPHASSGNINTEMDKFSRSLEPKHLDNAIDINKKTGASIPAVNSHGLNDKAFENASHIKDYDSVSKLQDNLKASEENLNNNPTNGLLRKRFLEDAKAAKGHFKDRFDSSKFEKEFGYTDPAEALKDKKQE